MTDNGTLNYIWSQAMVAGFVAAGVRRAVISPGSRSTPLALAMLRQRGLLCEVTVDERSAAFFALGIAKASQRPVLLLATSGTAPANWLPAVIEASQAGVPLILISADRPPELQGCGANQTVDQINLFGAQVRASHALGVPHEGFDPAYLQRLAARVFEQASWPHPGPVHINQPFREPLIPVGNMPIADEAVKIHLRQPLLYPTPEAIQSVCQAIAGRPGVIVCGQLPEAPHFPQAISALAAQLDCPIFAEPLSNLRFGLHDPSHLAVRYNTWLGDTAAVSKLQPEWVLRFGAYPVTRNLQNYVASAPVQIVVEPWPRWSDPAQQITHLLRADPTAFCAALLAASPPPCPAGWLPAFVELETNARPAELVEHIAVILDFLPENHAIFIGNSLAIRQLDTHSGSGKKVLHFYGNRGASGIDGNVSTALGIAAEHGQVLALLGDLTTQHDIGGLALAQGRDVVIVTVNNAGGGIFDLLPQAALPEFEQGWRTPQQINFEHAALCFGLSYARAENAEALRNALAEAIRQGGPHLIELMLA
jgi:2-succinyl-5-enolpyruvyl-6-hydroxy-3-cyclohexene-1-carboxylate synthase